jgi:hypothetical protein
MDMKNDNTDKINQTESDDYPLQKPDPEILPEPSIWPIGLAFGVLFLFWGFIASPGLTIAGIIIIGVSTAGWIADLKP